jgi:hypothetical protein
MLRFRNEISLTVRFENDFGECYELEQPMAARAFGIDGSVASQTGRVCVATILIGRLLLFGSLRFIAV